MKFRLKELLASLCAVFILSSCIDKGYDLSNVDTTVSVGTKELTIPINIDNITLDKVLNTDEKSQVKKVKDPVTGDSIYAVTEEGTFKSNDIEIPTFSSDKPDIVDIETTIYLTKINLDLDQMVTDSLKSLAKKYGMDYTSDFIKAYRPEVRQAIWEHTTDEGVLARYPITVRWSTFDTPAIKVHKAIRKIDYVNVDCKLTIEASFENLGLVDNVLVKDLTFQLPKGLSATVSDGAYNKETGIFDLSNDGKGIIVKGGKYSFDMTLNGIDFNAPDSCARLVTKENDKGEFTFSSLIKVLTGSVEIYKKNFVDGKTFFDLPKRASFNCVPDMTPIAIKSFTGKINYSVDGINVKSIGLEDLPDVIAGKETNIFLKNPQVYLSVNDPLADEGIYASANFKLTPSKDGVDRDSIMLDNGALRIDKADNKYCLSPTKPTNYYPDYESAEWQSFSKLPNIVSGHGLPDLIRVNILNPGVPEQQVTDFVLGKTYEPIQGKYLFYAPLSLEDYSVIIYEDKETGWNKNGDLDKLVISKLVVSANVTSDIPLGATLTLQALDKDGEAISGVDFSPVKLEANKADQSITFTQTSGTITNLDGISIRASITSSGGEALKPADNLKLENVRVTATATYTDKL